jgi:hypothetical protein
MRSPYYVRTVGNSFDPTAFAVVHESHPFQAVDLFVCTQPVSHARKAAEDAARARNARVCPMCGCAKVPADRSCLCVDNGCQ